MNNGITGAMTSAEVARAADVSVKTVTRWVAADKLVPIKRLPGPRGAFLFDPEHVASLVAERDEP
jgi:hypothetical protein